MTGTVRVHRTENCPLIAPEAMKKSPRGTSDYQLDQNTGVVVVRWHDNSVVTVVSNCYGVEPYGQAQRWSYAEKKSYNSTVTSHLSVQQRHGRSGSNGPEYCNI